MYFSRSSLLDRRCSSCMATCSSMVRTPGGIRPNRPNRSRSPGVKAEPLLYLGSWRSCGPSHGGVIVDGWVIRGFMEVS